MKALTILPPYALQIWAGTKTIEYRTWHTKYRGDLLICSSNKRVKNCVCGHALCVAELYDITPRMGEDVATKRRVEIPGAYVWHLRNVRPVKPIPLKGYVSLWNADVEDRLEFLPRYPEDGITAEEEQAWIEQYIRPLLYKPDAPLLSRRGIL